MITLQISGRDYELDDKIREYVDRKIGSLDKYLAKRSVISGDVILIRDVSNREDNMFVCEAIIEVPGDRLQATEATVNMFAAIDIVEQKLKAQILKFKEKHEPAKNKRRMLFGKMWGRDRATNPGVAEE
jgi:putative sigma-54 modulation protein